MKEEKQISFDTYPPSYMDDYEYDRTMLIFCVPLEWAKKYVEYKLFMTLRDFTGVYDWDDTFFMLSEAEKCGVVIDQKLVERGF